METIINELVIASNNQGKVVEIKEILGEYFEKIYSLKELGIDVDVEETGSTFFENSLIKAKAISEITNKVVIADDSGLCVDALNGEPGIYSARYAGSHGDDKKNRDYLLKKLDGVENRKAKFCSSVVLYYPNGKYLVGNGETCGTILYKEEGTNGFGYDSLFYSDDLKKSFGIASREEKNTISHRFRALMDLKRKL